MADEAHDVRETFRERGSCSLNQYVQCRVGSAARGEKTDSSAFSLFYFYQCGFLDLCFFFFFGATSLRSAVLLVISVSALPLDAVEEAAYVSGGLCPTFEPH